MPQPIPNDNLLLTSLTALEMTAVVGEQLPHLDRAQLALLYRYMRAMQRPVQWTALLNSNIATPAFMSAVANYLSLHHATKASPLNKKEFEFLFAFASTACGLLAQVNTNTTDAAADVIVAGEKFSLKTQADKAVKSHSVYIQKLMEARWIRDINSAQEFLDIGILNILSHLQRYERILVLRAFPRNTGFIKYELLEVPKTVFSWIGSLPVTAFPQKNKYGTCALDVPDATGTAFRLVFDGSVEKIRIFNLRTDRCIVHGQWDVQVLVTEDASDASE